MALVPGVLALLPEYAGLEDPVAELRAACLDAVAWLAEEGPVVIIGDPQGERVGRSLLQASGVSRQALARLPQPPGRQALARLPQPPGSPVLVVGNGSACRSEKAPGYLDERSFAFDDDLRAALTSSDLKGLDLGLGESLLASLDGIRRLPEILDPGCEVRVDYDDDPFGVQYWVMRWTS